MAFALDLDLEAFLKAYRPLDDTAYRPAMRYGMHSRGPRRTSSPCAPSVDPGLPGGAGSRPAWSAVPPTGRSSLWAADPAADPAPAPGVLGLPCPSLFHSGPAGVERGHKA